MKRGSIAAVLATSVCIVAIATPAQAQTREYRIPAGSLKSALDAYARQAGRQVIYKVDDIRNARSSGAQGNLTIEAALDAILNGTGFAFRTDSSGAIAIIAGEGRAGGAAASDESADIVVTGSHIRGAPSISPVTTITREDARHSGQTDLGQVMRDLPQNFAGGQNPTISASGQGGFTNVSGSSALNLRGLGPDASLTLINGHRVAFDAISQGIDISAIPLAAIERIDVVADGASALYGSDAVAGVANITLRRDIDGVVTSARLGAATDGGAVTQQYNIVAGSSWRTGGFMVAADYQDSTEITARQRSYTGNVAPDATLIPAQDQISLVTAGHQAITEAISFELDGHYMHRSTSRCLIAVVASSCYAQGSVVESTADSWSVSPALQIELPSGWNARLSGTYSKSDTDVFTRVFTAGTETYRALPNYSNELKSVELSAEGSLFSLPGGEVNLTRSACSISDI